MMFFLDAITLLDDIVFYGSDQLRLLWLLAVAAAVVVLLVDASTVVFF
jgi:hypothetical protein